MKTKPYFRCLCVLFLMAAARLSILAAEEQSGAVRILSQTVGTDELLLALAEPAQIAGLSHLATDPRFSAVAREAVAYQRLELNSDAEGALKFKPTLVLCADYSRAEFVSQMRRAGVRVLIFDTYRTMQDAYANLRLLARELGAEAKAERLIAACEARVSALHERLAGARPVRVLVPSTYGLISGSETTFQDICDHARADNLASSLGGLVGHQPTPVEKLLTWPVEFVVLSGRDATSDLETFRRLPPYQFMSAVKEGRTVHLPGYLLSCVTHHRIDGYELLARQLHPERFK